MFNVFSDMYGICGANVDLICDFCFTLASDIRRGRVGRRAGRRPLVSKLYPKVNAKRPKLTAHYWHCKHRAQSLVKVREGNIRGGIRLLVERVAKKIDATGGMNLERGEATAS